jgi:hypothetical protein
MSTGRPTGIAADHRQHRQLLRRPGLAAADRQRDRREPQIELGDLAGHIRRPGRRIRRQIDRPQLGHPRLEHGHRPGPADPLGDHRGRHRRERLQQLPDPRLDLIDDRRLPDPLVLRWPVGLQRRPHGVPGDAQHPGDLLDRDAFGPM